MKDQLEKNNESGKKKLIIVLSILALIVTGGLVYYFFFAPEELEEITYQTGQVKQGDIILSIENSGVIKSSDQATLTSSVNGTIKELYISENSTVKVNDQILKLDDRNLNIQLEQAYSSKRIAEINLANLLQTAVADMNGASIEKVATVVAPFSGVVSYNTQKGANVNTSSPVMNLVNNDRLNFVMQVPVDDITYIGIGDSIEIAVDNYLDNLIGTVSRIDATPKYNGSIMSQEVWVRVDNPGLAAGMKGQAMYETEYTYSYARGVFENGEEAAVYSKINGVIEDIYVQSGQYVTKGTPLFRINSTSLANQIESQKQNIYNDELKIKSILLDLEKTTVKAASSGLVTELLVAANQTIGSGTKIASLSSNSLVASIEVDELDIAKIEIGQSANLLIPGYSEIEEVAGTVSYIASVGKVKDGITTYEVQISFNTLDKVKEGMTVDAAIILQQVENVLKVPTTSIIDIKDGKAVRVMVGEEVVAKKVEVGISDDTMSEIISGLEKNQTIITSITYPEAKVSTTPNSSSLLPSTDVKIPGITGGSGGGGGGGGGGQ